MVVDRIQATADRLLDHAVWQREQGYKETPGFADELEFIAKRVPHWLALDREATALLNALYDVTDATLPEEIQAWFDLRVGGTDERYEGMIGRLRATLRELHS